MALKRRRGNLLITVLVFFMLALTMGSLFSLSAAQKTKARLKAAQSANTMNYVTIANLCADAFKSDLESQTVRIVPAGVDNPEGEYGFEIYDEALQTMQSGLTRQDNGDGTWLYTLTDPNDIIEFTGLTDSDTVKDMTTLLKDARVDITVTGNFSAVGGGEDDQQQLVTGDKITLGEIYYQVVLRKGTWKITQDYCLKNEAITGRFEDTLVWMAIDGERAENDMTGQIVSSRSTES